MLCNEKGRVIDMKKTLRVTLVSVLCVVVIVGLFYYFAGKRSGKTVEDAVELTDVQQLVTKDLDITYPETPREVVKLYSRIIDCFYGSEYSDDELYQLGDMARKLFDEDLLENNPRDVYFRDLEAEIAEYKENSTKIINWSVSKTSEIVYETLGSQEYAYVDASYFLNGSKTSGFVYQTYMLRKDADGKWKILAFYETERKDTDGGEEN